MLGPVCGGTLVGGVVTPQKAMGTEFKSVTHRLGAAVQLKIVTTYFWEIAVRTAVMAHRLHRILQSCEPGVPDFGDCRLIARTSFRLITKDVDSTEEQQQ